MTDKSRKSLVCSSDTYMRAINKHTEKDREVYDKVLKKTESKAKRHMRTLRRVTGMGELHPNLEKKARRGTN